VDGPPPALFVGSVLDFGAVFLSGIYVGCLPRLVIGYEKRRMWRKSSRPAVAGTDPSTSRQVMSLVEGPWKSA
jgi:hypothetical protein